MKYIKLTEGEKTLLIQSLKSDNERFVKKCKAILLASQEIYTMQEIAEMLDICRTSVHYIFKEWEGYKNYKPKRKIALLSEIGEGRGAKSKLEPIKDKLPDLVKKCNRRTKKLLQIIEENYGIKVTRVTLQNYLRKIGL